MNEGVRALECGRVTRAAPTPISMHFTKGLGLTQTVLPGITIRQLHLVRYNYLLPTCWSSNNENLLKVSSRK